MRKWIIVEDEQEKANGIIYSIRTKFPEDKIIWIYAHSKKAPAPDELEFHGSKAMYKNLAGEIEFYWPKNEEEFIEHFDKVNDKSGILLLDIKLSSVGDAAELTNTLKKKVQEFLGYPEQDDTPKLVTFITTRSYPYRVKKDLLKDFDGNLIRMNDARIIFSQNTLMYTGVKKEDDCNEIITLSEKYWNLFYGNERIGLNEFLYEMSFLSIGECHRDRVLPNEDKAKLIQEGKWSKWDMPIQLEYLIKLLHYDPNEFVSTFCLKQQGEFSAQNPVLSCLKTFGNKDSYSFSVLGAFFIAWATYRSIFPNGGKNEAFIEQMKKLCNSELVDEEILEYLENIPSASSNQTIEVLKRNIYSKEVIRYIDQQQNEGISDEKIIADIKFLGINEFSNLARNALVTPPQKLATLQATMQAFHDLCKSIFISTKKREEGLDILDKVTLDNRGLSFKVKIAPEPLFSKLSSKYKEKLLNSSNTSNSQGGTSSSILEYLSRSNYSDLPKSGVEDYPLLGSDYGLKIFYSGQEFTTIRLGYAKN